MKIVKTKFKDTYLINHSKKNDKRGFFMRVLHKKSKNKNVSFNIKQTNYSYNKKLTLGFHFHYHLFQKKKLLHALKENYCL